MVFITFSLYGWAATKGADNCADNQQHNKDEEQNLGNTGRCAGDSAEAQYGRDNGKNEKCECPGKHDVFSIVMGLSDGEGLFSDRRV